MGGASEIDLLPTHDYSIPAVYSTLFHGDGSYCSQAAVQSDTGAGKDLLLVSLWTQPEAGTGRYCSVCAKVH